jgi:hypothetical protein
MEHLTHVGGQRRINVEKGIAITESEIRRTPDYNA